ncbi:MAG: hypothetical protein PHS99_03870 [Candidatus Marinimicrobia bacterium]|nr:hypothetical protein [Candidatus Neomarinimicrobiota bacterium]
MKKIILFTLVLFVFIASPVIARGEGFGLGIILGEPTGLSGKVWMNSNAAVDMAAAWSFGDNGAVHLHGDYVFHNKNLLDFAFLYYGIGAKVKLADDIQVGIRIPVGLVHTFQEAPLDVFFEIVPGLNLIPDTDFYVHGGLGIRYYF